MINIAILGFGKVGSGVAEVCDMNRDAIRKKLNGEIHIKKILDTRDFSGTSYDGLFTKDADEIFTDPDIKVIVETIGGIDIAYEYTKRALMSGKSVVTSNKELVATYGPELLSIAYEHKLSYLFEASVGGGIPIIRPLNKCLSANQVESIYGILNGTTNYILTKMKNDRISFEKALQEAQEFGYAERDPTDDITGKDACRKIAILSSIATGEFIDYNNIYTEGISLISDRDMEYADLINCKIKLIAMAKKDAEDIIELCVSPAFIELTNPLSIADDVFNAILVEGNALGQAMFYGKGAGKLATASAVVADIIEAGLHINLTPHKVLMSKTHSIKIMNHDDCQVKAFIRIKNNDETIKMLTGLKSITDIDMLPEIYKDEIAIVVGGKKKITEKELSDIVNDSASCLSMIRIL
ncbi:MAG: homoserine dehydrogenase [Saccharofermentanales bacterium]